MLKETAENINSLIQKIQAFDFVLNSAATLHKEETNDKGTELHKRISKRKVVLMEELLRLLGENKD